ncbi:MAG: carbamoyl-phosphate-synthetase [Actinomycetes bacterium]
MVVLLAESASLTARETLTVLGMRGVRADVLATRALSIGRFSRWRRRSIPVPLPSRDPLGYLAVVRGLMTSGDYEAVLATHEQAWLFAAGRSLLPQDAPMAVAPIEAFDRVQGKADFATLLDELHVPQPGWWLAEDRPSTVPYPHWVKASHGTAGRSVRCVANTRQEREAIRELSSPGSGVMGQVPAPGEYGQVQALFDRGRLIAVHTSVQVGYGAGGSAAARLSVDHPEATEHVARIGEHLAWHGGLTLDYLHVDGHPQFIECNPRTVEPGNAAHAGVDFPALTIALSTGEPVPDKPIAGRAGVRTRSAMALALGAAERHRSRAAVLRVLRDCALSRGEVGDGIEVLTPVRNDPPSGIPLTVTALRLLAQPNSASAIARGAVDDYAISPESISLVRTTSKL